MSVRSTAAKFFRADIQSVGVDVSAVYADDGFRSAFQGGSEPRAQSTANIDDIAGTEDCVDKGQNRLCGSVGPLFIAVIEITIVEFGKFLSSLLDAATAHFPSQVSRFADPKSVLQSTCWIIDLRARLTRATYPLPLPLEQVKVEPSIWSYVGS